MHPISRSNSQKIATVASGAALSDAVDYRDASGGVIITPATLDATTVLAFKVCNTSTGTFVDLRDKDNAVKTITVALDGSHAYPLPDELFGAHFFKIWCQASGTGVNQTGDKSFTVMLKG